MRIEAVKQVIHPLPLTPRVIRICANGKALRDQDEVRGYYAALDEVDRLVEKRTAITEAAVQRLHALLIRGGKTRVLATKYRDGQNGIRDSLTDRIVYLPPEAKDVPVFMSELIVWLRRERDLPVTLKTAIAHYQVATIHPYCDGNGRTARLLTTLILHLGGYGLNGSTRWKNIARVT